MGRAPRALNVRLIVIGAILVLGWVPIGIRLFSIQALASGEHDYAELGLQQRSRVELLAADRGTIFDRHGVELAVSVGTTTVYANPGHIADAAAVARELAPVLGMELGELEERLTRDSGYVVLMRSAENRDAALIRDVVDDRRLPGIYFIGETRRFYPAGQLASQVIGFVQTDDNSGLEGLELTFDEVLAGTPGELVEERDPQGRRIPQAEYRYIAAEPGADIVTTLDPVIQFAAEQALGDAMEATGATGGAVVVLEVGTGGILAMANAPTFDPNDRSDTSPEAYRNRAVTDRYEPGSTLKVVTLAGALNEGVLRETELLEVPMELEVDRGENKDPKVYRDVARHPLEMSVADIVAQSSNVGTILIQSRLGNELHYDYLRAFGLGSAASGDFTGESNGWLEPVEDWCSSTCGPSTAIGYRVDATVLQMAAVFGAIANDGVWVQPHIVTEVIDAAGSHTVDPVVRPVVSEETARVLRELLAGVVERGTGTSAAVTGYSVAGKTGTTEKWLPEEGRYSEDDRFASFIGMVPARTPRLVVAVMLDSPNGDTDAGLDQRFGGVSAAPVFAQVAEAALHQLGVPPDGVGP
ncbi:MAG: penicillin-binding protein 2 [Acidimicrobiia bacterium]|nr:penicillin-binding protein 2 [Acidimicrobiia bacterium]NNK92103.1 penicillin-binding protein 2 [Acidimicrobiia bacterium]